MCNIVFTIIFKQAFERVMHVALASICLLRSLKTRVTEIRRTCNTSNKPFFINVVSFRLHRRWDRRRIALSDNICPRVPIYTCAGKCGPSISLCIWERDFGIASRLVIPSLASLRPIERAKKKTDDFTLALGNSQLVPEIFRKIPAHRSCYS